MRASLLPRLAVEKSLPRARAAIVTAAGDAAAVVAAPRHQRRYRQCPLLVAPRAKPRKPIRLPN